MQSTAAVRRDDSAPEADEPLFSSAHAALTFAYNHTMQAYDAPTMVRILNDARATGKGLGGIDGAGQAGFIKGAVKELPRLYQAMLVARFAPRDADCPCCRGKVDNLDWLAAIREISDAAAAQALSGHITARVLRDAIVARYYGKKVLLAAAADRAGVSADTATRQNAAIVRWLRGTRTTRLKGGEQGDGIRGEDDKAMDAISAILGAMQLFRT